MAFKFFKDVLRAAGKPVRVITKAAGKIPVLGKPIAAVFDAGLVSPFRVADNVVSGKRIDKVVYGELKTQIKNAQTVAPYAQAVVSLVPGVGTGVSGVIGAANALSKGQPITAALVEGVRGAVPGGPAGQAAFNFGMAVMQGKKLDTAALAAIPLPEDQKRIILQGALAAKDLANGKRADRVLADRAIKALPPDAQKAMQIGLSLAHAKNMQDALKKGSALAAETLGKEGMKAISRDPVFRAGIKSVSGGARKGFAVGVGLMGRRINPTVLKSVRKSLLPRDRRGFDVAVAARVGSNVPAKVEGSPAQQFGQLVAAGVRHGNPKFQQAVFNTIEAQPVKAGFRARRTLWQRIAEFFA